jgi:hypothetical protein
MMMNLSMLEPVHPEMAQNQKEVF